MKKIIAFFICSCLLFQLLSGCVLVPKSDSKRLEKGSTEQEEKQNDESLRFVKSVWIAYYELGEWTNAADDADTFQKNVSEIFENIQAFGFNTVTVQVRPCADAFYNSAYFPVSRYCFEDGELHYDPLKILCDVAETQGLRIEAWINPYRVSQNVNTYPVSETFEDMVYVTGNRAYLNPANPDTQELIVNGVTEIVKNYDVDAIHFDDYFYPTTDKEIDEKEYTSYQDKGGKLSLSDWRRDVVTTMIEAVKTAISKINNAVQFGISPSGNITYCRDSIYADVENWCAADTLDYICPQLYYGFLNESLPYEETLQQWCELTTKPKLFVGLPLYKSGKEDAYASSDNEKAKEEFIDNTDILVRQAKAALNTKKVSGIYVFSYSSVFEPANEQQKQEVENLRDYFADTDAA